MKCQTNEHDESSVSSYLSRVERLTARWNDKIRSNNVIPEDDKLTIKFFFRGHGDKEWKLRPSLFRSIPGIDDISYAASIDKYSYFGQEQYVMQEAMRLCPNVFASAETDIQCMTICQHYALPTRLLDVSGNALVALYFAVSSEKDKDGVVYVFRASSEDYKIASTAGRLNKASVSRYHEKGEGPISVNKRPLLVFPPHETMRQKAQDGSFYLFENDVKPFHLNEFSTECFQEIAIRSDAKSRLMKELETTCNIHKGTLFPEFLDSYVSKLKEEAELRIKTEVGI